MENFPASCARDRDLGNMPTNQGKLDNGEWRCSSFLEGSGLIPLDNGRNAGKGRQWRTSRCAWYAPLVLPFIPEIREMLPMENFLLHRFPRPLFLPFVPEIRDILTMEKGSRALALAASSWRKCITWLTDGQWSNGGCARPLMQSSRTWDPE